MSVLFSFAPAAAQEQADVRVMTFNIRYGTAQDGANRWEKRRELLVETIQAFGPDLLGTQETLAFQRDYLAEKLPGYEPFGAGRDDGRDVGEMAALFYQRERFEKLGGGNFWLSETPEKPGSKGWDSSLPRLVSWVKLRDRQNPQGQPIAFFNTHFDNIGDTARLESARLLRSKLGALAAGCSVIVTGDFNAGEGSPPYQALFAPQADPASPVLDAYRAAHAQREQNEGTFTGFDPNSTSGARIDWIGLSRDWRVTEIAIDRTQRNGRVPSDHFPVSAVLTR